MTEVRGLTADERWIQENEHELWPDDNFTMRHVDCHVCGPGPIGRRIVPSAFKHIYFKLNKWSDSYGEEHTDRQKCKPSMADVVSSELEDEPGKHTVMLDLDVPSALIPSSTPGHYHLYIDVKMSWWRYRALLKQLSSAGIIEKGYYEASLRRKATHLRPPWVRKQV
jgi:hypothetical protein